MNTSLKNKDYLMLKDALASNGGGVRDFMYSKASLQRLIKAGYMQYKNDFCHVGRLVTLTKAGKEELEQLSKRNAE